MVNFVCSEFPVKIWKKYKSEQNVAPFSVVSTYVATWFFVDPFEIAEGIQTSVELNLNY